MILDCQNISKSFGTDEILKNVSFHINDNEKAAIVGINGAGKSTLLKIIMQQLTSDTGEVILSKNKTVGYLAQYQDITGSRTIYEEVLSAKSDIILESPEPSKHRWSHSHRFSNWDRDTLGCRHRSR